MLGLLPVPLALCSCYFSLGTGAAIPAAGTSPREPSRAGAVVAADGGFQYDHRRLVRVLAFGSLQMSHGVSFEVRGQSVKAPYETGLGLDVTAWRRPDVLLRVAARVWPFSQQIRLATPGATVQEPGSNVRTALLGVNWHVLGDRPGAGPIGASFMAGRWWACVGTRNATRQVTRLGSLGPPM